MTDAVAAARARLKRTSDSLEKAHEDLKRQLKEDNEVSELEESKRIDALKAEEHSE